MRFLESELKRSGSLSGGQTQHNLGRPPKGGAKSTTPDGSTEGYDANPRGGHPLEDGFRRLGRSAISTGSEVGRRRQAKNQIPIRIGALIAPTARPAFSDRT